MDIVYRKGKMRNRTMIEFDMDIYDRMYCYTKDTGLPMRDIVDKCIRAGIDTVGNEILKQIKDNLDLEVKYAKEQSK